MLHYFILFTHLQGRTYQLVYLKLVSVSRAVYNLSALANPKTAGAAIMGFRPFFHTISKTGLKSKGNKCRSFVLCAAWGGSARAQIVCANEAI